MLQIESSMFFGSRAENLRTWRHQRLVHGGNGANGITISNSNGLIENGNQSNITIGNDGADGIFTSRDVYDLETVTFNAGNGGHGLAILNSDIKVNFSTFEDAFIASGGKGGEGAELDGRVALPGEDGLPVFIDENSTITYETNIENWMVH